MFEGHAPSSPAWGGRGALPKMMKRHIQAERLPRHSGSLDRLWRRSGHGLSSREIVHLSFQFHSVCTVRAVPTFDVRMPRSGKHLGDVGGFEVS